MNILIVDDQPTVVEGVLAGVNWEKLHIREKYKAYNISEAKEIITSQKVDLMLCDIEMPMGSGLELQKWLQTEKKYDIKCIFLTAHSDFAYAREAVHLQSFDYLLQPVSYQQIEETLQKAIEQIHEDRFIRNYYSYGRAVKKREKDVLKSMFRDYLLGVAGDAEEVKDSLAVLSFPVEKKDVFELMLIQILEVREKGWEDTLMMYAVENVAEEYFRTDGENCLSVQMDAMHLILFQKRRDAEKEDLAQKTKGFERVIEELLPVKVVLFLKENLSFDELPKAGKKLMEEEPEETTYEGPDLDKWVGYLKEGYDELLQKEAMEYLEKQIRLGHVDRSFLKQFHRDYIYLFFDALKYTEHENDYNYDAVMNSYTSVNRMKSLILFSTNYLKSLRTKEDISVSRMEEIMNFIHHNIQKNITRKDVAEAVYLNPEYLSRLFRKEKNMKLSDYILEEKMAIAKHLLETTNFTVSIVASKVGYTNFSHFAQCFKRLYGVSPSEITRGSKDREG
jgi:two-component system response regulator YesN